MRLHILSALLGVTATLLAVALFWPGAAPTTHAQNDGVLQLDPEWNNVAYDGDPLPIEQALNDALGITDTVWVWRSLPKLWDSWTQGALDLLNSLSTLDRGDVVWMRTSEAGLWTQLGAAQEPGAAGLSCWDLNGDGVFDAETEDANADGVADALDCRGDPGLPGRACWDLNANGEPDPAEDITGDGTANALDCRGPAGPPCWDTNGNGVGDITEDLNGDLLVNFADCRGPAGFENLQRVAESKSMPAGVGTNGVVFCPSGTRVVSGGYFISGSVVDVHNTTDYPDLANNAWRVVVYQPSSGDATSLTTYALCAD